MALPIPCHLLWHSTPARMTQTLQCRTPVTGGPHENERDDIDDEHDSDHNEEYPMHSAQPGSSWR